MLSVPPFGFFISLRSIQNDGNESDAGMDGK